MTSVLPPHSVAMDVPLTYDEYLSCLKRQAEIPTPPSASRLHTAVICKAVLEKAEKCMKTSGPNHQVSANSGDGRSCGAGIEFDTAFILFTRCWYLIDSTGLWEHRKELDVPFSNVTVGELKHILDKSVTMTEQLMSNQLKQLHATLFAAAELTQRQAQKRRRELEAEEEAYEMQRQKEMAEAARQREEHDARRLELLSKTTPAALLLAAACAAGGSGSPLPSTELGDRYPSSTDGPIAGSQFADSQQVAWPLADASLLESPSAGGAAIVASSSLSMPTGGMPDEAAPPPPSIIARLAALNIPPATAATTSATSTTHLGSHRPPTLDEDRLKREIFGGGPPRSITGINIVVDRHTDPDEGRTSSSSPAPCATAVIAGATTATSEPPGSGTEGGLGASGVHLPAPFLPHSATEGKTTADVDSLATANFLQRLRPVVTPASSSTQPTPFGLPRAAAATEGGLVVSGSATPPATSGMGPPRTQAPPDSTTTRPSRSLFPATPPHNDQHGSPSAPKTDLQQQPQVVPQQGAVPSLPTAYAPQMGDAPPVPTWPPATVGGARPAVPPAPVVSASPRPPQPVGAGPPPFVGGHRAAALSSTGAVLPPAPPSYYPTTSTLSGGAAAGAAPLLPTTASVIAAPVSRVFRPFQNYNAQASPTPPRPPFPRRGLVNLGNTCYINSVLQCINMTQLGSYLQTNEFAASVVDGESGRIVGSLSFVLRELRRDGPSYPVSASSLKKWIGVANDQFSNSSQQDANEFLRALLDGVHEDMNVRRVLRQEQRQMATRLASGGAPQHGQRSQTATALAAAASLKPAGQPSAEIDTIRGTDPEIALQYLRLYQELNSKTVVVDLAAFQVRSCVQCLGCRMQSRTFDVCMSLELPIATPTFAGGSTSVSITDCLDQYVKAETLSGDSALNCSQCRRPQPAQKKLLLYSLPRILIICLKRYKSYGNFSDKVQTDVTYGPQLDMASYLATSSPVLQPQPAAAAGLARGGGQHRPPPPSTIYSLKGVVNHQGSLSGGHYTADVRGLDGMWYYFSDDVFKPASSPVFARGYMLFYELDSSS